MLLETIVWKTDSFTIKSFLKYHTPTYIFVLNIYKFYWFFIYVNTKTYIPLFLMIVNSDNELITS